jgi:hypothetical protein
MSGPSFHIEWNARPYGSGRQQTSDCEETDPVIIAFKPLRS